MITAADTKIKSIDVKYKDKDKLEISSKNNPFQVFGIHDVYKNESIIGDEYLPFANESTGTQSLYVLGGKILSILESGGVLAIDELDTSLHPFITKMIVMIFQNKNLNPKNAQLIFTTHDVTLLDRDLIRRDQIWISEKDEKGVSDLYSLQDFDGVREDTPFDKWYLAGKFGGLPKIESIESIFTSHD
ncbi:MAG: ATP-binding protein [Saprospiraceae bacterium]|nr:ATP-binding protein [Saprospiraceae bacterium]